MEARDLLNELLAEIAVDERALVRKREIAQFLEGRLNGIVLPERAGVMTPHATRISLSMPPRFSSHLRARSVSSDIAAVAASFNHAQYDVNALYDGLEAKGLVVSKTHISTVMGRLVERGIVEISAKGTGSVPNRYRNVQAGTASAPSDDDSTDEDQRQPRDFG